MQLLVKLLEIFGMVLFVESFFFYWIRIPFLIDPTLSTLVHFSLFFSSSFSLSSHFHLSLLSLTLSLSSSLPLILFYSYSLFLCSPLLSVFGLHRTYYLLFSYISLLVPNLLEFLFFSKFISDRNSFFSFLDRSTVCEVESFLLSDRKSVV